MISRPLWATMSALAGAALLALAFWGYGAVGSA